LKTLSSFSALCAQTKAAPTVPLEINLTGVGDYGYHANTVISQWNVPVRGYHLTEFKYKTDEDNIFIY